jgi:hypothetical protein
LSFHWYSRKDAKVSSRSVMSMSEFGVLATMSSTYALTFLLSCFLK